MATSLIGGTAAPVTLLPRIIAPMPAVARILSRFDRPALESFLSVAIELLGVMDGDPDDSEAVGDEVDGNGAEDEPCGWFAQHAGWPGCLIADPSEATDLLIPDYGMDQAFGPTSPQ